jgi:anaerobic ribonucleoside-triphosphate reductase
MQGHFSGAIGLEAVNVFLAPYLVGKTEKELKQLAQIVIYEFSQQAAARGGQVIFSDLNLYWGTPNHYQDVEAIGPGGHLTGLRYKDYDEEAKAFLRALMSVYMDGDGSGRPFFFPKPDCHITEESVKDDEYLNLLGEVASARGNPYFIFDRGSDPSLAQCCRLRVTLDSDDIEDLKEPWKIRFVGVQNVSINLPGIAFRNRNNESRFYDELAHTMELAGTAHKEKMDFVQRIQNLGARGPLELLNMRYDGRTYVRPEKCKFLMGIVGLNEAVQMLTGEQLHESSAAYKLGMKIVAFMHTKAKEIGKDLDFNIILEQTPAESTAYRFAKLDLNRYGQKMRPFLRGNVDTKEIYYTNSSQLNVSAPLSAIERVKMEGRFHPLIDAGSMTHIWLGESQPPAESIAAFVRNTHYKTKNAQIDFSPEFTTCNACFKTSRGLSPTCSSCGSTNVKGITRVTGYFSVIQGWNIGKQAELKDRYRLTI